MSLESIYNQHRQGLFTLALSITGCQTTAEDAIHQVFLRLTDRQLGKKRDPVAYLFRSVRNSAIDLHRGNSHQKTLKETIFNGYVPPPSATVDDPHARMLTAERDQILREAIEELPDTNRQTVLLKTFSDLTFEQIGVVLDIPGKTAATRYRRALQTLQQKLKGQI